MFIKQVKNALSQKVPSLSHTMLVCDMSQNDLRRCYDV